MTLAAHPYADKFPMLPEAELRELAESIRANGLRNPVVITEDGLILDGRNRSAACEMVGIEPETVVYEGDDLAEYVIDCNVTRRNMSTGARAMSTALVLAADGRREDGRWRRGSVQDGSNGDSSISGWIKSVQNAGTVLDFKPDLAKPVMQGELALDAAYQQAKAIKDSAERDKIMAREKARREREEAAADAERNAKIVADLAVAGSKYVGDVESGHLSPAAAWAAHLEDTRKEREREQQLDQGRRDSCRRIAECVRFLDGGSASAQTFVDEFLPHEHRFLAEPMRLTAERLDSALNYLTTLRKAIK